VFKVCTVLDSEQAEICRHTEETSRITLCVSG
jgi:hypothetical protein